MKLTFPSWKWRQEFVSNSWSIFVSLYATIFYDTWISLQLVLWDGINTSEGYFIAWKLFLKCLTLFVRTRKDKLQKSGTSGIRHFHWCLWATRMLECRRLVGFMHTYPMKAMSTMLIKRPLPYLSLLKPRSFLVSRIKWNFFPRADSRVKMWRFFDVSETNSVSIFRVWWRGVSGSTKPPSHPVDGDGFSLRNVGNPRKFNWVLYISSPHILITLLFFSPFISYCPYFSTLPLFVLYFFAFLYFGFVTFLAFIPVLSPVSVFPSV
jgi:hypothetical protein